MINRKTLAVCATALILSSGAIQSALAQTDRIGTLTITNPWTRATPPRAQSAGGFLAIDNAGSEPDRLIGASSPIAGRVELHEMRMADGTMLMRPVEGGIEIPSGGRVTLAPGGLHIMFMKLNKRLHEGDTIAVTLDFERAGQIEVSFPVQAIGARGPAGAEPPGDGIGNGHEHGAGK